MNKSLTSNDVLNVSRLNLSMSESEKIEKEVKWAIFFGLEKKEVRVFRRGVNQSSLKAF